jgi:hypothetical protein
MLPYCLRELSVRLLYTFYCQLDLGSTVKRGWKVLCGDILEKAEKKINIDALIVFLPSYRMLLVCPLAIPCDIEFDRYVQRSSLDM